MQYTPWGYIMVKRRKSGILRNITGCLLPGRGGSLTAFGVKRPLSLAETMPVMLGTGSSRGMDFWWFPVDAGIEGSGREGEYRMEKERKTEAGTAMDRNAEGMCCHRTKERSDKEYRDLLNRLNRIEGQVRGIKGMVEKNAYCPDILIQVAAVNAALNSFNKVLLANHIRTCVMRDIQAGKEETIDELVMTLQKLMK